MSYIENLAYNIKGETIFWIISAIAFIVYVVALIIIQKRKGIKNVPKNEKQGRVDSRNLSTPSFNTKTKTNNRRNKFIKPKGGNK